MLETAAALASRPGPALNSLGVLAAQQGRWPDARAYFEKALQADPALESAAANLRRLDKEGR